MLLNILLWIVGLLLLGFGIWQVRQPLAHYRSLEATQANLRRYDDWRVAGSSMTMPARGPTRCATSCGTASGSGRGWPSSVWCSSCWASSSADLTVGLGAPANGGPRRADQRGGRRAGQRRHICAPTSGGTSAHDVKGLGPDVAERAV